MRLVLLLLMLSLPASAADPAPPIVFDAEGKGHLNLPVEEPVLPEVRGDTDVSGLEVYGTPWWWRSRFDYDPANLYLYGDPYAGNGLLEPRVGPYGPYGPCAPWPGW